jgi:5-amino-6-(5-phosphoribosylamino)uracil reductase
MVRAEERRAQRVARGLEASPVKVTVTAGGQLDPDAAFFTTGEVDKLVYCASPAVELARDRLGKVATVVDGGDPVDLGQLTEDLYARGVRRLMVEGGGIIHTQFLTAHLADELHLVVAPFFVGDSRARRFVGDGRFPWHPGRRATLAQVRQIGDVVLLRYALSARFPDGLT